MTASNTASGATKSAPVATSLVAALSDLREAAVRYATAKASRKVEDWAEDLDDFVTSGGPTTQAVFEGVKAKLRGKNPVWAAIKGAWSGASPKLKLAVVLILILILVLAPVVLLVLLLVLLVAALVAGIRAATQ
jgi:ABC-type multidrug transport system fused ATPase/permease subunit